ncbi:copper resistance CopC family protein, partial [Nonomuraea lactucae]|uniref:copper resistance CopC family protein n=1 Tax=Nonomuraea lactucae TaxID=2249762 RepID=UPI0013B3AC3C
MRRLLTVLLLACATVGVPLPALAHNVLIGSDPKDGATLPAAPGRITLVFDQPVRQGYVQVGVTGPDGTARADGAAVVVAEKVTVKVKPLAANGEYLVGYRILSADGHPVTGKITFTLAAGPATPSAQSEPSQSQPSQSEPSQNRPADAAQPAGAAQATEAAQRAEAVEAAANGGAGMAVLWIVGALLVLAAGTAVALR